MSELEMTGERFVPQLRGQIYYEHVHRYALAARFCKGGRVVDIASGEGYGSALLAQYSASVTGIDISADAIEHARKVYYRSNLRFLQASTDEIPVADASTDVVVSFETIEHVADHQRMLREIRRILKPEGRLVISSPNKLIYSDEDRTENAFHVGELYYAEFRDALLAEFPCVTIFGQQIAATSVISPLDVEALAGAEWLTARPTKIESGLPSLPRPVYFIAVCGPEGDARPDLSSAFIDPADDLLREIWIEVARLRQDRDHYKQIVGRGDALALSGEAASIEPVSDPLRQLKGQAAELSTLLSTERAERQQVQLQLDEVCARRAELEINVAYLGRRAAEREDTLTRELREAEERSVLIARALEEMRSQLESVLPERAEYYRMLASKSWRIMLPLRLIARALARRSK
jgi:O-antigen biosynthesis protein